MGGNDLGTVLLPFSGPVLDGLPTEKISTANEFPKKKRANFSEGCSMVSLGD